MPADSKSAAEEAINEAKTALAGSDIEAIKAATEKLQQAGYKLAEVAYSQQGADQAAGAATGPMMAPSRPTTRSSTIRKGSKRHDDAEHARA